MTDVIDKLLADLKLRLRRKQGPKPKETANWGAVNIPFSAPLLLSVSFLLVSALGTQNLNAEGPLFLIFGPLGCLVFIIGVFTLRSRLNQRLLINAYRKLLTENERFTLYEYCRYLKRRISAAEQDPSLGGAEEVARLQDLSRKLMQHLREGSSGQGRGIASSLAEEAQMAEAVLEAYDLTKVDPLKELDSRLPEQVRTELERLDREVSLDRRELE